jgi:hypothetical protein
MPTENPHQIGEIAPRQAGFLMTPEWHRALAELLRWLNDPNTRALAQHHENLAKAIEHRRRQQQAE